MKKEKDHTENNENSGQEMPQRPERIHNESLGNVWMALTGINPAQLIPQVVGTVLKEGGTRPPWKWERKGQEYIAIAWPAESPVRACVLMAGPVGENLKPVTALPLIEGFPNDLTVEEVHPRQEGFGADVAVGMIENKNPMWFFDPFYTRDKDDLTPGVTHTFWLAGVAFAIRKAMLDHVTLTSGPQYESYASQWLADNPDRESRDVPPLKIDVGGKHYIMPGRFFGEYQIRAVIEEVEDLQFEKMPVKALYLSFPFDNRPSMRIPLYASDFVLGDYKPEKGHDMEAHIWLQGRIIDLEAPGAKKSD